jgi:hypothetical protein
MESYPIWGVSNNHHSTVFLREKRGGAREMRQRINVNLGRMGGGLAKRAKWD